MTAKVEPSFFDLARVPHPKPYDIVWCHWPFDDVEGFKDRPALVKSVAVQGSQAAVEVVYGSGQITKRLGSSFVIENLADLNLAGLYLATRFDLERIRLLPWGETFFKVANGKTTPIVGRLPNSQQVRLQLFAKQAGLLAALPIK